MKRWKALMAICGSCIALYIGSGFATMQEVLQYEASYGSLFWVVIAVTAVIYVYTNLSFAANGSRLKLSKGGDIYKAYCGTYIGSFYNYFSAFFCYMSFVVMLGGANSTAMQQWGLPSGIGAIVLTLLVVATVCSGLKGILKALSCLGPIIIGFLLLISTASVFNSTLSLDAGLASIDSGFYQITQIGGGNPLASGASYGGFVILWFATFLAEIGANNKLSDVNKGMLLSGLFIFGVAVLCCLSLISNIDVVYKADIPTLVLANRISPSLGSTFSIVVFVGIYTSAVPLLWTGICGLADEGTKKYRVLTLVGGILGCAIACLVPYAPLLNILYGLNGYLGFLLIFFMVVNDFRLLIGKRRRLQQ